MKNPLQKTFSFALNQLTGMKLLSGRRADVLLFDSSAAASDDEKATRELIKQLQSKDFGLKITYLGLLAAKGELQTYLDDHNNHDTTRNNVTSRLYSTPS